MPTKKNNPIVPLTKMKIKLNFSGWNLENVQFFLVLKNYLS